MRSVWMGAALAMLAVACRPKPEELADAVEKQDAARVATLLDRGADPNARGGSIGWYVLSTAADNGDIPTIRALLAHHADTERADNHTPVAHAAFKGRAEAVRVLLAAGANANPEATEGPLALAIDGGDQATIDTLLAAGADVNGRLADGVGEPPLVIAAAKKRPSVIRQLLAAKARIDQRDSLGMTALARATAEEDAESVRILLAAGASPLVPSLAGWTPAFTAKYHDKEDLLDLYRDAGVTDWDMHPAR